jgi:IclR family pca regulon transcriptional regulator
MARREQRAFTRHTLTGDDELHAEIARVREQGWALLNQELEEGLISIAAPIRNARGQTVAALNISGQANRTSEQMMRERLLPQLLAATRHISQLLSASGRMHL